MIKGTPDDLLGVFIQNLTGPTQESCAAVFIATSQGEHGANGFKHGSSKESFWGLWTITPYAKQMKLDHSSKAIFPKTAKQVLRICCL